MKAFRRFRRRLVSTRFGNSFRCALRGWSRWFWAMIMRSAYRMRGWLCRNPCARLWRSFKMKGMRLRWRKRTHTWLRRRAGSGSTFRIEVRIVVPRSLVLF
ncbi:hypothetical protein M413DRAFT_121066 [Hebeloma cylindrosporum]|uniref:Uncharacterized protein n=1 Tax=Hebeloma cylindrosporum TaxID=76867 RepID=A0A0C3CGC1_HEBCY|nr:hypothetical protein M413DRAFT_121066 [Hebeloma cylindrosporum h7]